MDIFKRHVTKNPSILLVDASGSVHKQFDSQNSNNQLTVFDYMMNIIKRLDEEEFRIIFWNSDANSEHKNSFKDGIYKLPFIVKKDVIHQPFTLVKKDVNGYCLTYPHLAFNAIQDSWINNIDLTRIYFITDGAMGYNRIKQYDLNNLKTQLGSAIKSLFNKFNNIQLNIITIEPKNVDFSAFETERLDDIRDIAGCDVYHVIMKEGLTQYISKFVSYTQNNLSGYIHINKNIPPKGFVPFEDKYFSKLNVNKFIEYLIKYVDEIKNCEDDLLKLIQNLSSTLSVLCKDVNKQRRDAIIRSFCSLFNGTKIDPVMCRWILSTSIQNEDDGRANIISGYRSQLRELYKKANEYLYKSVKDSVDIGDHFISFPVDNTVVVGYSSLINEKIKIQREIYPESALKLNNVTVPVLPLIIRDNKFSEQCLRQWTRRIVSKLYDGVSIYSDLAIYSVLGICIRIVCSDISDDIKHAYQNLGKIMLQKAFDENKTLFDHVASGELPINQHQQNQTLFNNLIKIGGNIFNKILGSMTIWCALCVGLGNNDLISKQLIHCYESLKNDFPNINLNNFNDHDYSEFLAELKKLIVPIKEFRFSETLRYDYRCLITLDDISNVGGYKFKPHKSLTGMDCSPVYILSQVGYSELLTNNPLCPICYKELTPDDFEQIGKMETTNVPEDIFKNVVDVFNNNNNIIKKVNKSNFDNIDTNNKGILIMMKGTVGAGKSTASAYFKEIIDQNGGICIVEGVDKYNKDGIPTFEAINIIKNNILRMIKDKNNDEKLKVVIIDTCNEKDSKNNMNVFDINFARWTKLNFWPNLDRNNLNGYLKWTLRNVLRRDVPNSNDNFWLNPRYAGLETCLDVHKKKSRSHFGKRIVKFLNSFTPLTVNVAIKELDLDADIYEKALQPIKDQVNEFIGKNGKIFEF